MYLQSVVNDAKSFAQVKAASAAIAFFQKGYCHLVVASMAVIMFGAMCRYDDVSGLRWRNIRFVEDGSGFEITCELKKTNTVRVTRCWWPPVPMQLYAL
jgi:hypothetical protein